MSRIHRIRRITPRVEFWWAGSEFSGLTEFPESHRGLNSGDCPNLKLTELASVNAISYSVKLLQKKHCTLNEHLGSLGFPPRRGRLLVARGGSLGCSVPPEVSSPPWRAAFKIKELEMQNTIGIHRRLNSQRAWECARKEKPIPAE